MCRIDCNSELCASQNCGLRGAPPEDVDNELLAAGAAMVNFPAGLDGLGYADWLWRLQWTLASIDAVIEVYHSIDNKYWLFVVCCEQHLIEQKKERMGIAINH